MALSIGVACSASGAGDEPTPGGSSGSIGSSGGGDGGGNDLGNCGAESHTAQTLPLDMVFLVDASGSMNQTVNGGTKWAIVKSALVNFVDDPKSAGLGVGLQIFPIRHPAAPSTCTSSAQCTGYGKCTLKACHQVQRTDPYIFCDTSADCPGNVACRTFGACTDQTTGQADAYCLVGDPEGSTCPAANDVCAAFSTGQCENDECVLTDYAPPKVEIGALPGNAATFTTALNGLPNPSPDNATPTSIAEKVGLDIATKYGAAHPDHTLAVVLATDGLPTRCAPQDIPGLSKLAADGLAGTPSVKTFVIGVFTANEASQAQANLDAIASAGGSKKAIIISTSSNVTAELQKALDAVRIAALPCEYTIPPSKGGLPDYGQVNVQYTHGSGDKEILGYKTTQGNCNGPGWTYDVDPQKGTPTKIIVCPATCDAIKADSTSAKVDILLGCATVVK